MSMTLQLTPEAEARWQTRASETGLPLGEYVARFLETAEPEDVEGESVL